MTTVPVRRLGPFVDWLVAERTVIAVVLINTVAMTLAGFYAADDPDRWLVDAIDYTCILYFIVEISLKIWRDGWVGYRHDPWNRFDFLVTVLCLPALVEPFISSAHSLAWLPVFRAARLFRLLRLLRFIPDATGLAKGIGRALKASIGVFLALALVNLIFALAASFLFGEIAPEHFGDPARALYTLFQIFTLEGWNEYPELIEQRLGGTPFAGGARVFFMAAVLIGGVMGISLANAVFIDEMTLDNNLVLEQKVDALTAEVQALRDLLQQHGDLPQEPPNAE
ncbi:MAG: ion transporter [Acidobacteriota bacterium]